MRIAIEGGEGVGKSSLLQLLREEFSSATMVQEPSSTIIGRAIREIVVSNFDSLSKEEQTGLFAVDRAYQDKSLLNQDLVSNLVYQSSEKLSVDKILEINKEINPYFKLPDKVILLDIDPEVAQSRLVKNDRYKDAIDSKPLEFHKNISNKFRNICLDLEKKGLIKLLILKDNYYDKNKLKEFISN